MRKPNKLFSMLFAVVIIMSPLSIFTFAKDVKIPGGNIQTYVMTTKNNTPVYNSSKSSDKKQIGTIYASDLIKITKYSDTTGRCYVTYPTSKGNKSGWIKTEAITDDKGIFNNWMYFFNDSITLRIANKKITTYKRPGKSGKLGYISKYDLVRCFDYLSPEAYGGYVQVIYPVSGGYKMGWIKYSDLTNNCKRL
ncbi:MAG: hypothetical protein IJN96_08075 [Clostridia bacterium]|nr:hypothetical protein [Clostridia bacterium]